MFTGLIETTGKLLAIKKTSDGASLSIECSGWKEMPEPGESISVDGACLTVTKILKKGFAADLLDETLKKTCLESKTTGSTFNLERALRADGRLGGHIVTGHVDGTGTVKSMIKKDADWTLTVNCEKDLMNTIIPKGSVAINGVSLTVTGCSDDYFSVNIIPFTHKNTTLGTLKTGNRVNIETDVVGKYVRKFQLAQDTEEVTLERLEKAGFLL